MKNILLVFIATILFSCSAAAPPKPPAKAPSASAEAFCGSSTKGACQSNGDCIPGGCSGQICQSKKEEPGMSTCEFRECYNAANYGLKCGCVEQGCQWK